ncbi:protein TPX2-like isoform X3 [Zingiber officinale]|uniref:protein TPX2-like isoform X3 n=1 Tax=Zingiber officinale TaxID=94328 RepID=UPI001C4B1DBA|nr:protein TPX2-like isoform X3 [Zingiber officinale]
MDDEMEEVVPELEVFTRFEVDLDYEFDAPKFFDLSRVETPAEARVVELWFETAGSYPPSPLIAKLIFEKDTQVEKISTTSNLEDLEMKILHTDTFVAEVSMVSDIDRGCAYDSYVVQGISEIDHKSALKNPLSKISTLMKPTASQLAKQNQPRELKSMSRFRYQLECKKEKFFIDVNDYTHQAPKRQRLEKGHCYKVTGVKQQVNLFHKVPEKQHFLETRKNRLTDTGNQLPRLKLTIPREPELRTTRRALSLRTQQQKSDDSKCCTEGIATSIPKFKALPLNRKILEVPSLPLPRKTTPSLPKFKEFSFRTNDRALAHSTSASSMNTDSHNPTVTGGGANSVRTQPEENAEGKYMPIRFKAQTLNPKILMSKGDIGVYRCAKRESTKPKEFNFSTTKRFQQLPLAELFNELSLTAEAQQSNIHHKVHVSNGSTIKDSKENLIQIGQH